MTETYDGLQDRLTRLEAGEPLEAVLTNVPEEEAGLLKVAAALRALTYPGRAAEQVAAQRRELLRAMTEAKTMTTNSQSRDRFKSKPRPRWVWPAVFASGAAIKGTRKGWHQITTDLNRAKSRPAGRS